MVSARNLAASDLLAQLFTAHELVRLASDLGVRQYMPGDTASLSRHVDKLLALVAARESLTNQLTVLIQRARPQADHREIEAALATSLSTRRRNAAHSAPKSNLGNTRRDLAILATVIVGVALATYYFTHNKVVINQDACKIKCENCRKVQRAWIVLEDGDTYRMEVAGNIFLFRCIAQAARIAVVVEVNQDGDLTLRSTPFLEAATLRHLSLDAFSESPPPAFDPNHIDDAWQITAFGARTWTKTKISSANCHWDSTLEVCESHCQLGDNDSCTLIGLRYDLGSDVAQDLPKANEMYQDSCSKGHPAGCYFLGIQHDYGYGTPESDISANELYQKACELGYATACASYGYQLSRGNGVPKDDLEANRWLKRSCENNDPVGCALLGYQYDNGYGVEKDYKQANKMYLRSCNLFDGIACLRLGYNLEHGLGVPEPKIEQSEKYYARACLNGIPEACS